MSDLRFVSNRYSPDDPGFDEWDIDGQNATQTASGCKGGLQPIRIRIPGWDGPTERKAVGVAMWYDRHRREWVLYPVDEEGNQLAEARYGFSKAEALSIKADIEREVVQA